MKQKFFKKRTLSPYAGIRKNVSIFSTAVILFFTSCSKEKLKDSQEDFPSNSLSTVTQMESGDGGNTLAARGAGTGSDHGYFFSMYNVGGSADISFPNANQYAGNFQISYSGCDDVVGGKGWQTGNGRTINYNVGSLSGGRDFVGVYGWTRSPLIEYYVVESGKTPYNYSGPSGQEYGYKINNVTVDGHNYEFSVHLRKNGDNITGVKQDFWQYIDNWGGQNFNGNKSINMQGHINNWNAKHPHGSLSNYDYQVFGVEDFSRRTGSINATIW